MQISGYYAGYYPDGNAFGPPSLSSFFRTPDHREDTQLGNPTQSLNTNPYSMFAHFSEGPSF